MQKYKLLHISNNFGDQKIYINLVTELNKRGYDQVVYTAIKDPQLMDGNRDDNLNNVEYHYSLILKRDLLSRFNYFNNIKKKYADIQKKVDLEEIDLIHAHFLFSDGGLAYELKKKYGIKYVVSVRSSDVIYFFKYMIHLRKYGNRILKEAEKIIFINFPHRDLFINKYLNFNYKDLIKPKITVIPNAIDDRWFSSNLGQKTVSDPLKLIYVGRIIKTKRLDLAIKAIENLRRNGLNIIFNIIGYGPFLEKVLKYQSDYIKFHGKITDIDELKSWYKKSHIFIMPSTRETFGLVYIEALSQGLPIIYCKNQGVDGYFKSNSTGYAVEPNSIKDIENSIRIISMNYNRYSQDALIQSKRFNWQNVSEEYHKIYNDIN